ncbi:MAG TPA: HypC/HybG/HupF family hydrogenase formation chaperone [Streptosporangiaceae bacterium]|nr:HypC/HybG/HupF family hydrogenase formation chaperone [Streptosporangiaceae bacterium]
MCFGVPGRVTQIAEVAGLPTGKAEFGGVSRDVCFAYTPDVRIGDYVVVHAGFAVRLVAESEAKQALEMVISMPDL